MGTEYILIAREITGKNKFYMFFSIRKRKYKNLQFRYYT